ncbi:hypothetical protein B0H14DRAFT_2779250, partial [Mycena olivaceomarginata]
MASTIFGSLVAAICVNLLPLLARKSDGTRITAKFRVCLNLLIDTGGNSRWLCLFIPRENDDVQSNYTGALSLAFSVSAQFRCCRSERLLERFWKKSHPPSSPWNAFAVTILIMAVLTSWTNASSILVPFVWVALICNLIAALGITTVSVCQRFAMRTVTPKKQFTGLPSSIIAILALVAWAIDKKGESRVYSSTMMFALRNPLPPRADWIQDMISNSVPPNGPPSPDIFLKNEKTIRMSLPVIPELTGRVSLSISGKGIYLTATSAPETEDIASNAKNAVVLHRNAAFYRSLAKGSNDS